MTANVSIQATLNNSANNFVVSWQLASGGGIINSIAPTKPYGSPFQVNIPGLTPNLTYIVTLWESTTTSPSGTVRNATNVIPSATTTTLRADDYLTADITSGLVSGATSYSNTSYAGWGYDVERVGQGTMYLQGAPDVTDPDYAQDTAGGFHLVRTGDEFQPNEKFLVRFQPQVAPAAASSTGIITSGEIITGTTTLDATYLNKALFIQGTGAWLILTLPPLSSVSDWQWLYFYSAGGSHISAIITAHGSEGFQLNLPENPIVICQNEVLKVFKANGVWNIDQISASYFDSGELVYRYNISANNQYGLNAVPADGTLLNRNTYYRLWSYLANSGITPVSETAWGTATVLDGVTFFLNKGNWTMGTDGTNFRVPDLRDYFLRGTTASIGAGVGMNDTSLNHKHGTLTGLIPGAPNGKTAVAEAYNGKYYNQQNQQADLTDLPYNIPGPGNTGAYLQRFGTETAGKHVRIPILIRI